CARHQRWGWGRDSWNNVEDYW
nr:immunoglobulin heavy chain junction region [Macaca mulatta]